jgi:hypothetical protein
LSSRDYRLETLHLAQDSAFLIGSQVMWMLLIEDII